MDKNEFKEWEGFVGENWKNSIDVSAFIDQNYTEYLGDDSFLAPKTQKTTIVWNKCRDLLQKETQNGGCLDVETNILSGITAFGPGYIDKPNEVIVLRSSPPLSAPLGKAMHIHAKGQHGRCLCNHRLAEVAG